MRQKNFSLVGKNILVISSQDWGTMHLSKHHYALELARRGNNVYFLNPPAPNLSVPLRIAPHETYGNLRIVTYRPFFRMELRFHFRWVFDALMSLQVRWLVRQLRVQFDVLWCFTTSHYAQLRKFGSELIIYHVVDRVTEKCAVSPVRAADLLVSVAEEFLDDFRNFSMSKIVVGHGLAQCFVDGAKHRLRRGEFAARHSENVRCGYVGNLLSWNLGRQTFRNIVVDHPEVDFHIWGSYQPKDCNVAADDSREAREFVAALQASPNVTLYGVREPKKLVEEIQEMDCFLVCYDRVDDSNNSCNSHKLLEYLSTGKVIVSNWVSFYRDDRNLVCMPDEHAAHGALRMLFSVTVARVDEYNTAELQKERIEFALNNTYGSNVQKIEMQLGNIVGIECPEA